MPKGTLIIRAAEQLGIQIPGSATTRCWTRSGPAGSAWSRSTDAGNGAACPSRPRPARTTVADGMVVKTQLTSPVADKAQQGTMELLLINHPLDCPICDKGGECPLQNQAMSNGRADSRFVDVKRTYPKPIAISSQILLDRERCVLCARCTRFSEQIAGDPFIELFERGALQQVADLRGRAVRVLLLRQHDPDLPGRRADQRGLPVPRPPLRPGVHAEHLRALRVGLRAAYRLAARQRHASAGRRRPAGQRGVELRQGPVRVPLRRRSPTGSPSRWSGTSDGELVPTSWTDALERAAEGLREARDSGGVGVLPGGRLTVEDAYAYAKFARVALGTNDIDSRARAHSAEELTSSAARVAGLARRPAR